jgi:hypothetical protein
MCAVAAVDGSVGGAEFDTPIIGNCYTKTRAKTGDCSPEFLFWANYI